jgi:hypothetical protein
MCQTECGRDQLSCQKQCEGAYPQATNATCRSDCSSFHSTCFNNCNSEAHPGSCQTSCGGEQLVCQKDCEGRYPQSSDAQCRSDCSSLHSTCFNNCNSSTSPASCQTACSSDQVVCQKDCQTRYR